MPSDPKNLRFYKRNIEPFICTPYFGKAVTPDLVGFWIYRWENWSPTVLVVKAGLDSEPWTHFFGESRRTGDDFEGAEQFSLPVGTTNTLDTHLINVEFGDMLIDPFFHTPMAASLAAWDYVRRWEDWDAVRWAVLEAAGIEDKEGLPEGTRLCPSPARHDVLPPPFYVAAPGQEE